MGLISWFGATTRKAAAAVPIEAYFELRRAHGLFAGDPHKEANRVVELACTREPSLASNKFNRFALAAACLSLVLMEQGNTQSSTSEHLAGALLGIVKAGRLENHLQSYEDLKMLEVAERVYEEYRNLNPEPILTTNVTPKPSAVTSKRLASSASPIMPIDTSASETSHQRAKAMQELIHRMKT